MAFLPQEFRSNLIFGGARPNLFSISLDFPTVVNSPVAGSRITFLASATEMPGITVGVVPVYYFGRETKLAGNKRFDDWQINIINDEDFVIRNAFEAWSDALNSHTLNIRNPGAATLGLYSVDADIIQYSQIGVPIQNYKMQGCWPIQVSPMGVNWANNDQVEEFQVLLAVQEWTNSNVT